MAGTMPSHGESFMAVLPPGHFPLDEYLPVARRVMEQHGVEIHRPPVDRMNPAGTVQLPNLDFGGQYDHRVVDGVTLRQEMPHLFDWYETKCKFFSSLFRREVVTSPYPKSAITLKHYGPGDNQGWHYDTQPVTVLLWLTDCPKGGELVFVPEGKPATEQGGQDIVDVIGDAPLFVLRPHAGQVTCFSGRRYVHKVKFQPDPSDRLMLALNYYFSDDLWRPDGIDNVVYGSAAK